MAKSKRSKNSSDREKWNRIFNSMVHLVKKQQIQLESLAKERKILQDRILLQHERWVFDVHQFQDEISQMEKQAEIQELERNLLFSKADFITGLKNREAFVYKQKFENTEDELADFREWIERLPSDLVEKTGGNEVSVIDKDAEVASLLAEKNFVWNQYKEMESNLSKQLQDRRAEVESANEKIKTLVSSLDELQTSNSDKDKVIEKLQSEAAKLRSELAKKDAKASELGKESEASRKSLKNPTVPVLRSCSSRSAPGRSKSNNSTPALCQRSATLKKERDSLPGSGKRSQSSKRKTGDADRTCNVPSLFTSSFKVPKIKTPLQLQ